MRKHTTLTQTGSDLIGNLEIPKIFEHAAARVERVSVNNFSGLYFVL